MQISVNTETELHSQVGLLLNAGLICIACVPKDLWLPKNIEGCPLILCELESKSSDVLVIQKAHQCWRLNIQDNIFEVLFNHYLSN